MVVAGTTVKKTDAPFTLHLAALDPGSSGSSGGSSRADSGGCVVATRALAGAPALAQAAMSLRAPRGQPGFGVVVVKLGRAWTVAHHSEKPGMSKSRSLSGVSDT